MGRHPVESTLFYLTRILKFQVSGPILDFVHQLNHVGSQSAREHPWNWGYRVLPRFERDLVRVDDGLVLCQQDQRLIILQCADGHNRQIPERDASCYDRGRKGHITVVQQLVLSRAVRSWIPHQYEVWAVDDMGFQTVPILLWLYRQGWYFVIRQHARIAVRQPDTLWRKLSEFDLAPGETQVVGWVLLAQKHNLGWYCLILHWAKGEDEPWYLVSDCQSERTLLRFYKVGISPIINRSEI